MLLLSTFLTRQVSLGVEQLQERQKITVFLIVINRERSAAECSELVRLADRSFGTMMKVKGTLVPQ